MELICAQASAPPERVTTMFDIVSAGLRPDLSARTDRVEPRP